MKLEFGLVAGTDIGAPGGILEMDRQQALWSASRKILDGSKSKPVEPGLERDAFRLFRSAGSVAQCASDGFVDDFFFGDAVGSDFFGSFAKVEFALDKTLEAAEVGIDVRANVVGRGHRHLYGGDGGFKRDLRGGPEIRNPASLPFVRVPQ